MYEKTFCVCLVVCFILMVTEVRLQPVLQTEAEDFANKFGIKRFAAMNIDVLPHLKEKFDFESRVKILLGTPVLALEIDQEGEANGNEKQFKVFITTSKTSNSESSNDKDEKNASVQETQLNEWEETNSRITKCLDDKCKSMEIEFFEPDSIFQKPGLATYFLKVEPINEKQKPFSIGFEIVVDLFGYDSKYQTTWAPVSDFLSTFRIQKIPMKIETNSAFQYKLGKDFAYKHLSWIFTVGLQPNIKDFSFYIKSTLENPSNLNAPSTPISPIRKCNDQDCLSQLIRNHILDERYLTDDLIESDLEFTFLIRTGTKQARWKVTLVPYTSITPSYDRPETLIKSFSFMDNEMDPKFLSNELPKQPTSLSLPSGYFDFHIEPLPEFKGKINVEVHMFIYGVDLKTPEFETLLGIWSGVKESYRTYIMKDTLTKFEKLHDFHQKRVVFVFRCSNANAAVTWSLYRTIYVSDTPAKEDLYLYLDDLDDPPTKTLAKSTHLFRIEAFENRDTKIHEKPRTVAASDCHLAKQFDECQDFFTRYTHAYPFPIPSLTENESAYDIIEGFRIQGEAFPIPSGESAPIEIALTDETLNMQVIVKPESKFHFHVKVFMTIQDVMVKPEVVVDLPSESKETELKLNLFKFPSYFQKPEDIYGKRITLRFEGELNNGNNEGHSTIREWIFNLVLTNTSSTSTTTGYFSEELLRAAIVNVRHANQTIVPMSPAAAKVATPYRTTLYDSSYEMSITFAPTFSYQVTCFAEYKDQPSSPITLMQCTGEECKLQKITLYDDMLEGVTHMKHLNGKHVMLKCELTSTRTTKKNTNPERLVFMHPMIWVVPSFLLNEPLPSRSDASQEQSSPSWIPSSLEQVTSLYQDMWDSFCKLENPSEVTNLFQSISQLNNYRDLISKWKEHLEKLFLDKEVRCKLFSSSSSGENKKENNPANVLEELHRSIAKKVQTDAVLVPEENELQNDDKTEKGILLKSISNLSEMMRLFKHDHSFWNLFTQSAPYKQPSQNAPLFMSLFGKIAFLESDPKFRNKFNPSAEQNGKSN